MEASLYSLFSEITDRLESIGAWPSHRFGRAALLARRLRDMLHEHQSAYQGNDPDNHVYGLTASAEQQRQRQLRRGGESTQEAQVSSLATNNHGASEHGLQSSEWQQKRQQGQGQGQDQDQNQDQDQDQKQDQDQHLSGGLGQQHSQAPPDSTALDFMNMSMQEMFDYFSSGSWSPINGGEDLLASTTQFSLGLQGT